VLCELCPLRLLAGPPASSCRGRMPYIRSRMRSLICGYGTNLAAFEIMPHRAAARSGSSLEAEGKAERCRVLLRFRPLPGAPFFPGPRDCATVLQEPRVL